MKRSRKKKKICMDGGRIWKHITSNFLSSSSSISLFSSESVAYFKHELDYGARNGLNIFAPMLWLFEREPLNLIPFVSHCAFHLNHHLSEIIIEIFKDKI
jgi:hypothetical protein